MGTLAGCLKKLGITGPQAQYITDSAGAYKSEGFSAQEAHERAVKELIKETRKERKSVLAQLYDQLDDVQRASVFPAKKEKADDARPTGPISERDSPQTGAPDEGTAPADVLLPEAQQAQAEAQGGEGAVDQASPEATSGSIYTPEVENTEPTKQGVSEESAGEGSIYTPPASTQKAFVTGVGKDDSKQDVLFDPDGVSSEQLGDKPEAFKKPTPAPTTQTLSKEVGESTDKAGVAAQDIVKTWERMFSIPIRSGYSKRAEGLYKVIPETIRVKEKHIANLAVASHEIAHHIDKKTGISKTDALPKHLRTELAGLDYEPKGRVFEGFAEFIRHWVTEEDAKQVAPKFTTYFEQKWLPAHPEWSQKLIQARKHAREYADQTVFQRVRTMMGHKPGDDLEWTERFKARMKSSFQRIYDGLVSDTSAAALLDKRLKQKGYRGPGIEKMILAYRMADRANAARALEAGVFDFETGEQLSPKGYWERITPNLNNDAEADESSLYAHAKHVLFMREKRPEYNAGMSVEDAKRIVEHVQQDPDKQRRYDNIARHINDFAHELLDMAVRAGAYPRAERQKILAFYGDEYFPLWRVKKGWMRQLAQGNGFFNLPKLIKGRSKEGSGAPVMNPHDVLQAMAIKFYGRAARARIARAIVEATDPSLKKGGVEGLGPLVEKVDPKHQVHKGSIYEILDTLVKEGVVEPDDAKAMRIAAKILGKLDGKPSKESIQWFSERHKLDDGADWKELARASDSEPDAMALVSLHRPDFSPIPGKKVAVYYDKDGNPSMYQFDDFIHDSLVSLNRPQFNLFLRFWEGMTRVFKTGAIGLNTAFGVQNPISDYGEYIGRATEAKGRDVFVKPIELGSQYVAYRVAKAVGKPMKGNALFDLFDEMGGKLYTAIGQEMGQLKRERNRRLAKTTIGKAKSLAVHPTEAAALALSDVQEVIAATDVPARLAEMEASIKANGYVREGDKWRDLNTDSLIARLPEQVRIDAIHAAGEATVNYKRHGRWSRYIELFLPLSNAQMQALRKRVEVTGRLRALGQRGDAGQLATRYAVYLSLAYLAGMINGYLRGDDDDYEEGETWLYYDYFVTEGEPGEAGMRFRKPRDSAVVINIGEAVGARLAGSEARSATEDVKRDALGSLPTGGGLARAMFETFVTNFDRFREREVEPYYFEEEGVPHERRLHASTSSASKAVGQLTGRYLGISPLQVEHVMTGATGGLYHRLTSTWDAAFEGRLSTRDIPGVRGIVVNRHQARSVSDFYDAREQAKMAANRAGYDAADSPEDAKLSANAKSLADEHSRLNEYARLMTEIRKAEAQDGRRTYEWEPYLVGMAREALGRKPLEANPSPFSDTELPEPIKAIVVKFAERQAEYAILNNDRPQQKTERRKGRIRPVKVESDEDYQQRLSQWQAKRDAAEKWLQAHKDSPAVQEAVSAVRSSRRFKGLEGRELRAAKGVLAGLR